MAYYSSGNSLQRQSPVVLNLIIINVLVWLAQHFITQVNITEWGALHYYKSAAFGPHQLVTNIFMHDPRGLTHILFNMFSLYIFGSILERFWGSKRFIIFYLICGIGASIILELSIPYSAQLSVEHMAKAQNFVGDLTSSIELYKQQYSALGASGAIMGLMAAFAYLFPNTELYVMFIPVPVKAKYVIPVLVLIDLFGGFYHIEGDDIGHFAHLGGALIGIIIVLLWNKTNRKTFY